MAERDFEFDLERMFAQTPACPDPEAFVRRVESRLNRDWRLRTFGIGAAGVIGGAVAVTQTMGSGFGGRLQNASVSTVQSADNLYDHFFSAAGSLLSAPGVTTFWLLSAVVVVAAAVGLTRAFQEV